MLLRFWSDRHSYDFFDFSGLLELGGFLDCDLVKGVHGHLEAFQFDTCVLSVDSDLDSVVKASFNAN